MGLFSRGYGVLAGPLIVDDIAIACGGCGATDGHTIRLGKTGQPAELTCANGHKFSNESIPSGLVHHIASARGDFKISTGAHIITGTTGKGSKAKAKNKTPNSGAMKKDAKTKAKAAGGGIAAVQKATADKAKSSGGGIAAVLGTVNAALGTVTATVNAVGQVAGAAGKATGAVGEVAKMGGKALDIPKTALGAYAATRLPDPPAANPNP